MEKYNLPDALIYSENDEEDTGKGWYFEKRDGSWLQSQSFETEQDAIEAKRNQTINWS